MRYPPERKAETRDAVLKAAAGELRERGFYGVGVDGLSAAAGVTSGAFYSHFSNKEDVLRAVIDAYVGRPFVDPADGDSSLAKQRERLRAFIRDYVSLSHRDVAREGCVIPALSADVARSGGAVKQVYQKRMEEFVGKLAPLMKGAPRVQENTAWRLLSMMVGAVLISRAMPDKEQAGKVIDAALEGALDSVAE